MFFCAICYETCIKLVYYLLLYCSLQVNELITKYADEDTQGLVSPLLGNVCFASSYYRFCFTLKSFSNIYAKTYGGFHDVELARRLWGDIYFNNKTLVS